MPPSAASKRSHALAARLRNRATDRTRRSKLWARRARLDARDRLRGTYDPLLPPRRYGLPSQLRAVGDRIVEGALIGVGGLQPNERVLDVGCGPGRMAAPLTRYLSERGSYEGFDVMPRSIDWGRRRITPRHPNFRFQLADIHNLMYNPTGTQSGEEFRFPYADAAFDLCFAISLYTHLRPYETDHYLKETARVTRAGGRVLNTFFILNREAERLLAAEARRPALAGGGVIELEVAATDRGGWSFRTASPEVPEQLIAVHEEDVRRMYEEAGLEIERVAWGSWCGRPSHPDEYGQDLIVAHRR